MRICSKVRVGQKQCGRWWNEATSFQKFEFEKKDIEIEEVKDKEIEFVTIFASNRRGEHFP